MEMQSREEFRFIIYLCLSSFKMNLKCRWKQSETKAPYGMIIFMWHSGNGKQWLSGVKLGERLTTDGLGNSEGGRTCSSSWLWCVVYLSKHLKGWSAGQNWHSQSWFLTSPCFDLVTLPHSQQMARSSSVPVSPTFLLGLCFLPQAHPQHWMMVVSVFLFFI